MSDGQDVAKLEPITRRRDAARVAADAYRQLDDVLRALTAQDWTAPTACAGWSVSDMVGHLIGAARGNASLREFTRQQWWGLRHRREHDGNPLDAVNALQVAEHSHLPDSRRADVLRAVATDAVRGRMRQSAWFGAVSMPISTSGSAASGMPRRVNLGQLFDVVYTRDVWMHTVDIAQAVGREPPSTSAVNARIIEDVVLDWVRRHSQPIDLVLTGPGGGHYRWGQNGAVLELDAIDFCRILSGRDPGEGPLRTKVLF